MATINIKVDGVIYDTVFCTASIDYDEKKIGVKLEKGYLLWGYFVV